MLGQVVNTHLGYFSEKLLPLGLRIARQATVPDGETIREAILESFQRSDVVLVTGGLGPTSDDVTRDIVSELFNAPLEFQEKVWEKIQAYFMNRKIQVPEIARVQAKVPRGANYFVNQNGTAPGLHLEKNGKHVFCLPGPPRELQPMFEENIFPILKSLAKTKPIYHEVFRVAGIGEAFVQEKIEASLRKLGEMEIGYCARPREVDLRIITSSQEILRKAEKLVRETFGQAIYATGSETMEEVVVKLATKLGKTLATAESCTGGMIANRITNVSGASAVLNRGWVTYSNQAKIDDLGVSPATLKKHGAVSAEVAQEMALGALEHSDAGIAVATTGIAGPTGGTPQKPVGLIFFGIAVNDKGDIRSDVFERNLVRQREPFKLMASQIALDLIRLELLRIES